VRVLNIFEACIEHSADFMYVFFVILSFFLSLLRENERVVLMNDRKGPKGIIRKSEGGEIGWDAKSGTDASSSSSSGSSSQTSKRQPVGLKPLSLKRDADAGGDGSGGGSAPKVKRAKW